MFMPIGSGIDTKLFLLAPRQIIISPLYRILLLQTESPDRRDGSEPY